MEKAFIPKKIHYFWFGGNEKNSKVKKCISSWKKFCPDYEIIEWNEENYDYKKHPFMLKAYNEGKWAFVSDYARLDVLYSQGGIYLDTDVELIRGIDDLLHNHAYIGFEKEDHVADGLGFGGEAGFPLFKEMMECYDDLDEYVESPRLRTKVCIAHGLRTDGSRQNVDGMEVYPIDYFCPKSFTTGQVNITGNTRSIHHYDASWHPRQGKKYVALMRFLNNLLGEEKGKKIFDRVIETKDRLKGKLK
ncbi:MAG: glycosyl transferase [Butyrivibrio sp.]|nr:glycosyl transferase [Butyrivibrio sp.]